MLLSATQRRSEDTKLLSPQAIKELLRSSPSTDDFVQSKRKEINNILRGKDHRLLTIVGPCSIHNVDEALIFASELKNLADEYVNELLVVFRAYVEKPRTSVGWKGLVSDPDLDGSQDVHKGLVLSRTLFRKLNRMGLPVATEVLNPLVASYLVDQVSWASIGARTSESQPHRELASGLTCTVGVKNNTAGDIDVAISAMQSIAEPHTFISIGDGGTACVRTTTGNTSAHIVLRGGNTRSNYDTRSIQHCVQRLKERGLCDGIVVDCSHANSNKDHRNQAKVVDEILAQRRNGSCAVKGLMMESNICAGNQPLSADGRLKFGTSITDSCIDMAETARLIHLIAESVRNVTNDLVPAPIAGSR